MGLNHIAELENYFNGKYLVKMYSGETPKWPRSCRDDLAAFHDAQG